MQDLEVIEGTGMTHTFSVFYAFCFMCPLDPPLSFFQAAKKSGYFKISI
jgi:hypothetical protein